jgi:hypothetical protein
MEELCQTVFRSDSIVAQNKKFTDIQIDQFQSKADDFFINWINLVGYDGMTNYVHMLGSGHIRFFYENGAVFTGCKIRDGSSTMQEFLHSGIIELQRGGVSMTNPKYSL